MEETSCEKIDANSIKLIKTLSQHKKDIFFLYLLQDNRIASLSVDSTIRIYNPLKNYKCEQVLPHDKVTSLCQLSNGTLVTCSHNQSLSIGTYVIPNAHSSSINSVIPLSGSRLATCSDDRTIKIWSAEYPYEETPLQVLEGFEAEVKCIVYIEERDMLVAGDRDRTIQLWCMKTYKRISVVNRSDGGWIEAMDKIDRDRVIFGHGDIFTIVNVSKCEVEEEVEDAMMGYVTSFLKLNERYLVCGCAGGFCLYDMVERTYQIVESHHAVAASALIKIDENTFASCAENIKIWRY